MHTAPATTDIIDTKRTSALSHLRSYTHSVTLANIYIYIYSLTRTCMMYTPELIQ